MKTMKMVPSILCLGVGLVLGQTMSGSHFDAAADLNVSAPLNFSINSMAAASALAKKYYEQQTPLDDVGLCDHCAYSPRYAPLAKC